MFYYYRYTMAAYTPPTEILPIFDDFVFLENNKPMTYNTAVKKFLRFPIAQGDETLQGITVNGISNFKNKIIQTVGTGNVQVGDSSTYGSLTTGQYNVSMGKLVGANITSGSQNVVIGYQSGAGITTTSSNIDIGYQTGTLNQGAS